MTTNDVVLFKSNQFNTTETKSHYINRNCYGDDLAAWLVSEFKIQGITCIHKPGQEDFGWYVKYSVDDHKYCAVIGFRPNSDPQTVNGLGDWIICIENDCGFITSLFGRRTKPFGTSGHEAIRKALGNNPNIHDVKWHERLIFNMGNESLGDDGPQSV
jgi:hypothetical protein